MDHKLSLLHYITGGSDGVSLFQFIEHVAVKIPLKWKSVGVALGLSQSQIDAIERQWLTNPLNSYSDVFSYWQQLSTTWQPVSWNALANVLRSRTVGEESLADFIQKAFVGNN